MPWESIKLNDGTVMPSIAWGTAAAGSGQTAMDHVDQALEVGFSHIDTAQSYRNEKETGTALANGGLPRDDVFITTKYSGRDGLDINASIHNSVKFLGVKYVNLYLIHAPPFALPDIPTAWRQMEKAKSDGLTKSIGVSNFDELRYLEPLMASAKVKPVVNQIQFHPYNYETKAQAVEFCKKNDIVVEAYSVLTPLNRQPGGPVDAPVNKIANRLKVKPEQVLLAWAKAKGVVPVTASNNKERLMSYIEAGDLELTDDDIAVIDHAGSLGARRSVIRQFIGRAVGLVLVSSIALGVCGYMGIDVL